MRVRFFLSPFNSVFLLLDLLAQCRDRVPRTVWVRRAAGNSGFGGGNGSGSDSGCSGGGGNGDVGGREGGGGEGKGWMPEIG